MAKTASPSATEGIGIQVARGNIQLEGTAQLSDGHGPSASEGIRKQVATGTAAGSVSPAFWWPKQPALLPQKALVYR
jgi:hypothetical protein